MPLGRGLSSLIPPEGHSSKSAGRMPPETPPFRLTIEPEGEEGTQFQTKPRATSEDAQSFPVPSRFASGGSISPSRQDHDEHESVFSDRDGVQRGTQKHFSHEAIFQIETSKIFPNPLQPRREFDEIAIEELAESIRQFGIIQPLIVSKIVTEMENGTDVSYQLIAGERRLRAAKKLGLERVPAVIRDINVPGKKLEIALIENIQRRDLNPMEEARAYSRLQDEFGLTQKEIGSRVGKSREVIANSLRLLRLPSHMQDALSNGKITVSQARLLLAIENASDQERTFEDILNQKLSVRTIRNEMRRMEYPRKSNENPEIVFLQKKLEERLGMPVKIHEMGGKGKIIIEFFSEDEITNLLERFTDGI